jgi:hypothetical protein
VIPGGPLLKHRNKRYSIGNIIAVPDVISGSIFGRRNSIIKDIGHMVVGRSQGMVWPYAQIAMI